MFDLNKTIVDEIMLSLPQGNILKVTDIATAMRVDRRTVLEWFKGNLLEGMQMPSNNDNSFYITTRQQFRKFLNELYKKEKINEIAEAMKTTKRILNK